MTITPPHPDVSQDLREVSALLRAGSLEAAVQRLEQLDRAHPRHPDILRMRGIVLARIGRAEEAEPLLRAVADSAPEVPAAAADHAQVLLSLGRADEALVRLQPLHESDDERSLGDLGPVFAYNLGLALKGLGRAAEAVEPLSAALRMHPGHYGALIALGDVLKALGRPGDAANQYREAIGVQPADGTGWWALSNLKSGGFSDLERAELARRVREPGRDPWQQAYFEFAAATALDAGDEVDNAFAHYARGNRIKRELEPWDRVAFGRWLEELREAMDGVNLPQRPEPPGTPRPVFIVSLPRSGSTLTEQVLAAHSQVTAASELPWLPRVIADASQRFGSGLARWAASARAGDWLRIGRDYLDRCRHWYRDTPVFTDKLPGNLPFVGALLAMIPDARVVAVRRDPMDVCWSCYRQLFIGGSEFSYDLEDLAAYWKDADRHLAHWVARAPERVRIVEYERLASDPEPEIRALLDFLDLPFEEACLRPQDVERAVGTASASQVRQAIHRSGIGHWKRYASHLDVLAKAFDRA